MNTQQLLKRLLSTALIYAFVFIVIYFAIYMTADTYKVSKWTDTQQIVLACLPILLVFYYELLNIK